MGYFKTVFLGLILIFIFIYSSRYGGPGSQKVTEQFEIGWATYLTSSLNIIHASVDGRGSSGNGDRFMHELYKSFGTVEVEDQITAGR